MQPAAVRPARAADSKRREKCGAICRAETLTVCNVGLTGFDDERSCDAAVFCDPESGSCRTRS